MHRTQYPMLDAVIAAVTAAATFKRTLYRKLERKTKRAGSEFLPIRQQQACAADTSKNTTPTLSRDRGSLRKIFHATKLIDDPFARGEPANESSDKIGWTNPGNFPERLNSRPKCSRTASALRPVRGDVACDVSITAQDAASCVSMKMLPGASSSLSTAALHQMIYA
jgi:hypothetical protein